MELIFHCYYYTIKWHTTIKIYSDSRSWSKRSEKTNWYRGKATTILRYIRVINLILIFKVETKKNSFLLKKELDSNLYIVCNIEEIVLNCFLHRYWLCFEIHCQY